MATYALLKKPYTPVVFTSAVKTFKVYGKSFMQMQAVYLSGAPYNNQTFYNPFSGFRRLSADNPGFFAVKLLSSQYTTNFDNTITFTMPSAVNKGFVDVIIQNPAGYGKLTQYCVKELYTNEQTVNEIRPWSNGIRVLTGVEDFAAEPTFDENQLLTIDGLYLVTIANENIVSISATQILPNSVLSIDGSVVLTISGENIVTIT